MVKNPYEMCYHCQLIPLNIFENALLGDELKDASFTTALLQLKTD